MSYLIEVDETEELTQVRRKNSLTLANTVGGVKPDLLTHQHLDKIIKQEIVKLNFKMCFSLDFKEKIHLKIKYEKFYIFIKFIR